MTKKLRNMTKKLRVTGLEVETKDGKKVALTRDEARELYELLHGLFGKESPGAPFTLSGQNLPGGYYR